MRRGSNRARYCMQMNSPREKATANAEAQGLARDLHRILEEESTPFENVLGAVVPGLGLVLLGAGLIWAFDPSFLWFVGGILIVLGGGLVFHGLVLAAGLTALIVGYGVVMLPFMAVQQLVMFCMRVVRRRARDPASGNRRT